MGVVDGVPHASRKLFSLSRREEMLLSLRALVPFLGGHTSAIGEVALE
jgi:hypothetical protein